MDWHIITSSKGGCGKTLTSLMLLTYHRNKNEKVLVIDLNGMNADLRRLVAEEVKVKEDTPILNLKVGKRSFFIENLPGRNFNYMIGWARNAFGLFNPTDFCEFLAIINKACKVGGEIRQNFGPINTVIIDTSYHFCNLFPEKPADYEQGTPLASLKGENIFIWFLWVYRQLHNLITAGNKPDNPFDIDARAVKLHANTIEKHITNNILGTSPFVHVFSPVFIGQIEKNLLKRLARLLNNKGNVKFIEPLGKLVTNKTRGDAVKFNPFVRNLKDAYGAVCKSNTEDNVHSFFLKMLDTYITALPNKPGSNTPICPRNIIPIHVYQKELLGFADADIQNLLDNICELEVYRDSFEIAYNTLLGLGH